MVFVRKENIHIYFVVLGVAGVEGVGGDALCVNRLEEVFKKEKICVFCEKGPPVFACPLGKGD